MPILRLLPTLTLLVAAAAAPAGLSPQGANEESLGTVRFGAGCDPDVDRAFDRGVALLHHMTYPAALSAFEDVASADPECALAYWGMAMSLFQPLWPTRPGPDELARGWALVRAASGASSGDGREAGFIVAASAFFDTAGAPGYWTRIERWAAAHERLLAEYPEDREVRAFYALSHLAMAPLQDAPAEYHRRAAEVLKAILDEEPTHPGAVHYTIHANDFDGRATQSLPVVRSYGEIAPRNPHALHMPTHIFLRLGEWDDVIAWNERAAEAALAQRAGPAGEWVWDEYPHAAEYLLYAHLQKADDEAARTVVRAVRETRDLEPTFKTAFHLASMPARYALERQDWRMAASLRARTPETLPWDQFRWPEAIVWHARGIGTARLGQMDGTAEALTRIQELEAAATGAGEAAFAAQIRILALEVEAWQRLAEGNRPGAVDLMARAVALEESTPKPPVTPGATIPARELLAALYAEIGEHGLALAEYTKVEERTPNRFNTLLGLARSAAAVGDDAAARRHYGRLLDLAAVGSERPAVVEARSFTAR